MSSVCGLHSLSGKHVLSKGLHLGAGLVMSLRSFDTLLLTSGTKDSKEWEDDALLGAHYSLWRPPGPFEFSSSLFEC